jgi:mono/diheme cytochrome c family protein
MKKALRVIGIILLTLLVLLAIGAAMAYAQSEAIINRRFEATVPQITLPEASDELMAEGQRIFTTRGCSGCHGQEAGGDYVINASIFAVVVAPNLSHGNGGLSANVDAEDYMRAIMHGIGHDGRGLVIMPTENYTQWREEELVPLLVFLTNMPPIDNKLPATSYGLIGRVILALGALPIAATTIDHDAAGLIELEAEPSVEYGQYLSSICASCHGASLTGEALPDGNGSSANLTPSDSGISAWTEADFTNALRTGRRPDDTIIDPLKMPWPSFAQFTDTEIQALYLYLRSLEPVENTN